MPALIYAAGKSIIIQDDISDSLEKLHNKWQQLCIRSELEITKLVTQSTGNPAPLSAKKKTATGRR